MVSRFSMGVSRGDKAVRPPSGRCLSLNGPRRSRVTSSTGGYLQWLPLQDESWARRGLLATFGLLCGLSLVLSLGACAEDGGKTAQKGDGPGHYGYKAQDRTSRSRTSEATGLPTRRASKAPPPPVPGQAKTFRPMAAAPKLSSARELRQQHRRIVKAASLPHTAEAGCEQAVSSKTRRLWGPRAPRSTAGLVGKRVVVNFEFDDYSSSSRACRPHFVQVVLLVHDRAQRHVESSQIVLVQGRRGSVSVGLPQVEAGPPYYVRIRALGADRRPSREEKIRLD